MMFGIGVVEQGQLAGAALTRFATPQSPVTDDVGLEQAPQIFGLEPAQLGRDNHGQLIEEVVLDDDGVGHPHGMASRALSLSSVRATRSL